MKKLNGILWGIVLVAAGVLLAMDALNVLNVTLFFDGWWTLFIIVPCFIGLLTHHEKTANLIGLVVGVLLLLSCQELFSFRMLWKLFVPFVIVVIGLRLIFREFFSRKASEIKSTFCENNNMNEYNAVFSGHNVNFDGEVFECAKFNAVFGGIDCDLRGAVIEHDAVIEVCSIFGGVDLYLPDNVNIKVTSDSIFGGVSNKKYQKHLENAATIYIKASCIFGGADIK